MARFVYRLQKVYEMRERKKKEQEQRVNEARAFLRQQEARKQAILLEIEAVRQHMEISHHTMMQAHDAFLHKLALDQKQAEQDILTAQEQLQQEEQALQVCHQELEALVKHKEGARQEWLEEEKAIEMKMLDEIAGQRYFRNKAANAEEALLEGEDPD
jgi:flagellar export protein FliJ